jgi:hypothetical protein
MNFVNVLPNILCIMARLQQFALLAAVAAVPLGKREDVQFSSEEFSETDCSSRKMSA